MLNFADPALAGYRMPPYGKLVGWDTTKVVIVTHASAESMLLPGHLILNPAICERVNMACT